MQQSKNNVMLGCYFVGSGSTKPGKKTQGEMKLKKKKESVFKKRKKRSLTDGLCYPV